MRPEYAQEIARLARNLVAAAPPHAEGRDSTGCVHVVLGPDGLPAEIRVSDGWQRHLEAARLGSAVVEANTDAVRGAVRAWSTTVPDGGAPVPDPPYGHARDSNQLAEEAIAELRAARTTDPAVREGHDDGRHVSVQLTPGGLTACTVEPAWAGRQDGRTISAALSAALQRARVDRSPLDALIADALATLTSLTVTPGDEGGIR